MGTADGQVVGVTKIVDNGDPSLRWNLVILPDGYQQEQLNQFQTDAEKFVSTLQQTAPYDELAAAINVYRIDVSSTDSGAADPAACGGTGAAPHTYFDATFCGDGTIQRLLTVNDATVHAVVGAQMPQAHMTIVIVNSTEYGGSGGGVATFSLAPSAEEIALHEMGHTAFGFADEYCSYAGCGIDTDRNHYSGAELSQPNVTTNVNPVPIKWQGVITAGAALPTMSNPDPTQCNNGPSPVSAATVGAFEGAGYYHSGIYRGQYNCRMRALGNPFCEVCKQVIRQSLQPHLPA
ncbi:MAG TPA: M64 family metallopeptidase [Terriglobia bacterium]|nr:M64 family metallopeptidase [Terriglobia bacterium]